jgi:hypothetical protein
MPLFCRLKSWSFCLWARFTRRNIFDGVTILTPFAVGFLTVAGTPNSFVAVRDALLYRFQSTRIFKQMNSPLISALILVVSLPLSGCGLIFGGSQKVEKKSNDYVHARLDRDFAGIWRSIDGAVDQNGERSDFAYEHTETGAIISVNSACGPTRPYSLEDLSRNLIMGLRFKNAPQFKTIYVDGIEALQTTLSTLNGVTVQTIVLKAKDCAFDLMYVANTPVYAKELPTFEHFVKGFHVQN